MASIPVSRVSARFYSVYVILGGVFLFSLFLFQSSFQTTDENEANLNIPAWFWFLELLEQMLIHSPLVISACILSCVYGHLWWELDLYRECFLRMCSAFPVRHASTTHSSMQLLCTLWSLDGPGGLEELTISIAGFWGPFCRPLLLELSFLAAVIDEVEKMLCIIADSVHFWLGLIEVTNFVLIKNQLGRAKGSEGRLNDGKM